MTVPEGMAARLAAAIGDGRVADFTEHYGHPPSPLAEGVLRAEAERFGIHAAAALASEATDPATEGDPLAEVERRIETRRDEVAPRYRNLLGRALWPSMNLIYEDALRIVCEVRAAPDPPAGETIEAALREAASKWRPFVADGRCPTCQMGRSRETTGLVCQTCGTDYRQPADPAKGRDHE